MADLERAGVHWEVDWGLQEGADAASTHLDSEIESTAGDFTFPCLVCQFIAAVVVLCCNHKGARLQCAALADRS